MAGQRTDLANNVHNSMKICLKEFQLFFMPDEACFYLLGKNFMLFKMTFMMPTSVCAGIK